MVITNEKIRNENDRKVANVMRKVLTLAVSLTTHFILPYMKNYISRLGYLMDDIYWRCTNFYVSIVPVVEDNNERCQLSNDVEASSMILSGTNLAPRHF